MGMQQVHVIIGGDEFLRQRHKDAIIAAVREQSPDPQALTVTSMNASDLSPSELIEVMSPSLFSEDRVVAINVADTTGKEGADLTLEAAKDPAPGIVVIIQHTGGGRAKRLVAPLKKLGQFYDASPLRPKDLPGWVRAEFNSHGRNVTPDVVHALLEGVGSDLRELASAVEQLNSDVDGDITVSDVRAYYSGVAEVSSFDIADWAVSGQTGRAVSAARRALQLGESPVAIAAALSNKISLIARLYSLRGRVDGRALASQVGGHPFVIEKTAPIARRWSGENVSRAVILMADLDAAVKGQGGDPEYALEAAVRAIAEMAG